MIRPLSGRQPKRGARVFVADSAQIIGDVELADGVSIWFGAILRGDIEPIRIGKDSNVQDGVIMHTDEGYPVQVGERVTIGHAAVIHGAVVEDEALIGMGAILLSGARVGRGAVVAAGALVPERAAIPPGVLAMGVPARVVRPLSPEDHARIMRGVENYRQRRDLYLAEGFGAS